MGAAVHTNIDIHSLRPKPACVGAHEGSGPLAQGMRRVLNYGRVAHVRGATIYAVGRKEVERFARDGMDLSDVEGVQVVCSDSGVIMTVYRNRDFRGLRPRRRAHRRSW